MIMILTIIADFSSKTDVVLEVSLIFVSQGENWVLSYLNRCQVLCQEHLIA